MKLENGPREKLEKYGIKSLSDEEILALILKTGTKDENVINLSKRILHEIDPIQLMLEYSHDELMQFKGIGKAKAMMLESCFELYRRIECKKKEIKRIRTLLDEVKYLHPYFLDQPTEKAIVLYLSNDYGILTKQEYLGGGFSNITINSKDILKKCLRINCVNVVISHNHPGGNVEPSIEDERVFEQLEKLLKQFGINLMDSLIFTNDLYFSMKYNYEAETIND